MVKRVFYFLTIFLLLFPTFTVAKRKEKKKKFHLNEVKEIPVGENIKLKIEDVSSFFDISLKPSLEEGKVRVELIGDLEICGNVDDIKIFTDKSGDTLKVGVKLFSHGDSIWIKWMKSSLLHKSPTLKIFIPEKNVRRVDVKDVSNDLKVIDFSNGMEFNLKTTSGDLTIENSKFSILNLKSVSGDMTLNTVSSKKMGISSSSGNITLKNVSSDDMKFLTSSGDCSIENSQIKFLHIETSSGDVEMVDLTSNSLDVDTTSGECKGEDLHIANSNITTSSGDMALRYVSDINSLSINSVSGSVDVAIPEREYHMKVKTTTGDLEFNVRLNNVLVKKNFIECGMEGEPPVNIRTISGDIKFKWSK